MSQAKRSLFITFIRQACIQSNGFHFFLFSQPFFSPLLSAYLLSFEHLR